MQIKLKIIGGSHDGRKIEIKSSRFLIGRSKDCHLRPGGSSIGDHHCAIHSKEGVVVLQLLKNKSEVLVNGKPVEKKKKLAAGDRLKIGSLEFELLIDSGKATAKKPAAEKKTSVSPATSSLDDDAGQWLDEADEEDRRQKTSSSDSRVFQPSELPSSSPNSPQKEEESSSAEEEKPEKKEPGKLPPTPVEETKDSGEAAMNTLRKLFNRST